jgi:flagellar biosynthesis protein FlhF
MPTMQYQTFSGNDLKEALGAVRAAFGPDALIGPTRHVQIQGHGGLPELRVEVQAAPSGKAHPANWPFASALLPQPKRTVGEATFATKTMAQRVKRVADTPEETPKAPAAGSPITKMEAQIAELRTMVEALRAQLPSRQRALTLLQALGIEGAAARHLGARLGKAKTDEELLEKLGQRMLRSMPDAPSPLHSKQPELVACIGPTGAGKTTTLAKIAAHARLEHGKSVAVICLDHFRVGAVDQWQKYSKLMGIPVFSPGSASELRSLLETNPAELLLVDTPSVGSKDDPAMRAFSELAHTAKRSTHVLLLLPAWLRGGDAEKLVSHYGHLSPTGLVVTKLDECNSMGGILQAAIGSSLPLVFVSRGPRVPEHLEVANKRKIIEDALAQVLTQ